MRALGARAGVIVSVAAIVVGVMATTGSAANTAGLVHITARSGPSGRRKDAPATTVPSSTPPSSTTTTTSSTLPTTSATTTASPSPRRPVQTAGGVSGQSITCDTSWIVGNGSGDWTNAADWSSGVPDSTKNACLPAGSYTVSIAQESVQAKALDVAAGVTLSPQSNASLTLSGNLTNAGTIDMVSAGCCGGGASVPNSYQVGDQIVIPSGSTLTNSATGMIETTGCCQANMELTGNVTNYGTVSVSHGVFNGPSTEAVLMLDGTGIFDNLGSVQINDSHLLYIAGGAGYEFVNDTGGSIDNSGSGTSQGGNPANELLVGGGNTFTEGAGTTSHNPVVLDGDGDTLHFTGSGASTFVLHGTNTISGSTIASVQTVYLDIVNCTGLRSSVATLAGNMTNAGTINLNNPGDACSPSTAQLVVPSGSTLTNNGTIQTTGCCRGDRELTGNITNAASGVVNVNYDAYCFSTNGTMAFDGSGLFDNYGTVNVASGMVLTTSGDTVLVEPGGSITQSSSGGCGSGYGTYTQTSGTLGVTVDANGGHSYGINGGYTNLGGTLSVTTLGLPAPGTNWPVVSGLSRSGSFGNCAYGSTCTFDPTNYLVQGPSTGVTLVAEGADMTTSEPSSTNSGTPTPLPGGGVPQGTTVYDAATVTGNSSSPGPTGSVTFYLCSPAVLFAHSATACDSTIGAPAFDTELFSASGASATVFSTGQTVSSTGTWCFAAYYSGDTTYPASADTTTSNECFPVTAPVSHAFSQLDPTATTCQQFVASPTPSNVVGPLSYGLRSGKINTVSPGVFFYYSEFSASPGTTVDLRQSNNGPGQANSSPWPNFQPTKGQVVVYNRSCGLLSSRKFTQTTLSGNVQQIAVTIPSSASGSVFVVGIKFDSTSIDGTQPVAHTKPTVTYTFSTVIASTTESSAQLTLQPK